MLKIIEAPRDAMQGIHGFIPTKQKAKLINGLLKVGFDTIDFGSFVSPRAIPQLKDTSEVLSMLDLSGTSTKLMVIVGNTKGGGMAASFDEITYIGFPFSFSETFLKKNINTTLEGAIKTVDTLQDICLKKNKKLVVYLAMAFGTPYGDPWSIDLVIKWAKFLEDRGIETIPLSDIIASSTPEMIADVFSNLSKQITKAETGLHLHTLAHNWYEKVDAAYKNGCRRFDGVINGVGGCPMAGYELVGNLDTRLLIEYFDENNIPANIDRNAFEKAIVTATETYPG
ncbi:MAG: hydroxymethylglutaryl-CoA lyase [Bacteroidetes bacterium 4484_276]|nr:MAG: hydroxymethylglutaryl-CoA lyase [Bacteroidetes bacterium 4484_276]OYT14189.1 MAG: hydroxymethylglutaryl-CoA lyase [Bacteroidetes bacterium 4572_114]